MNREAEVKETGAKILVVDDQAGMRLTLKGILNKRGYDVTVAQDGMAAIEEARKAPFQVILMDIKMPGMSGVEAFVKIKELNPHAVVIMMTAFAVEEEIRRAIREGAYAVIHKPFEMDKILGIIVECLKDQTLVLVVDDRLDDRELLKMILKRRGYRVMEAGSGEECVKAVKERQFQVILLDIQLPGINGIETLKAVKMIRPDVGVIMVTAHSEEELIEEAMRLGSFRFLEKPLDVEKLLDAVDKCVKKENPKLNS